MDNEQKYKEALEKARGIIVGYNEHNRSEKLQGKSEDGKNKTVVDSKSGGESKGAGGVSGKNVRPLSSMTNIERQEWGLILVDELKENPYSWLIRHNFLEEKIDIGLSKNLKGPNPPI